MGVFGGRRKILLRANRAFSAVQTDLFAFGSGRVLSLAWALLEVAPIVHKPESAKASESAHAELRHRIEHAAHLLPAQGPITAFVHHNTLHAFEDLPFEKGVVKGGEVFGCHPFLPELRYRAKLERGRFTAKDIEAVLREDLGATAEVPIGPAGTRLQLQLGMLAHPLRTGPASELLWMIEETNALRKFRPATPVDTRETVIEATRHWIMRDLRNGATAEASTGIGEILTQLFERFDRKTMDAWEESTWETFCLHLLWMVCRAGVKRASETVPAPAGHLPPLRHCKLLHEVTGEDCDQLVDEILIRFCAAFLDQDFAARALPHRGKGFLTAFKSLYGESSAVSAPWLRAVASELNRTGCPLASIRESLDELGVRPDEEEEFLAQTLLALRGFAGMIWQVETRGDRVAKPAPPGSLIEYLAVRLILERGALKDVASDVMEFKGGLNSLRGHLLGKFVRHPASLDQRAFQIFQLAQVMAWTPELLWKETPEDWESLLREIEAFSAVERRRIYHLAFERRYRIQTLDAITLHSRRVREAGTLVTNGRRRFQIVCCIDDREESFRRALEEVAPDCETFGAAGFFAVAMNYRGAADAYFTPLCPVIIEPRHYVVEDVVYTHKRDEERKRRRRRTIGTVTHQVHAGSRTFAGGWLAAAVGSVASIPLVTRILFPRLASRMRGAMGGLVRMPAVTQLELERSEETPENKPGHIGYSIAEMAGIVERLLRDIGLTGNFSRLVIICGHGSSSLNNPHEAAYDCGACSGNKGGPNARAFALMANNRAVRAIVTGQGLEIPKDTVFLGAYHNTCSDRVDFYDLDKMPGSHAEDFERVRRDIEETRRRNAHERCRRFVSAPLDMEFEEALEHVEGRSEDLSQARPECGHATNALCFVGRRSWSRGLFLDRRAFLQSYDPAQDDHDGTILTRILQAVIPVCGGINLEYYFSYVDPVGYGCGTKLPHNITALLGVMNGPASDLRTGLPWQMVEIHEPVRLLFVIEATPGVIDKILDRNPPLAQLVRGHWVQLATVEPATSKIHRFKHGRFEEHTLENEALAMADSSPAWYRGWREHLGFASLGLGRAVKEELKA